MIKTTFIFYLALECIFCIHKVQNHVLLFKAFTPVGLDTPFDLNMLPGISLKIVFTCTVPLKSFQVILISFYPILGGIPKCCTNIAISRLSTQTLSKVRKWDMQESNGACDKRVLV